MSRRGLQASPPPRPPGRVYDSYRPARLDPPLPPRRYESYRTERSISPSRRLRDTFRRESRDDFHGAREPLESVNRCGDVHHGQTVRQTPNNRDNYARKFSSAASQIDERRPEQHRPPTQRQQSIALQSQPPTSQPARFSNMTWVKPASQAPQTVTAPSPGQPKNGGHAGPTHTGRSDAGTAAIKQRESRQDDEPTGSAPDNVSYSIRGAAAASSSKLATLQGAGPNGFTIRGIASASSPGLKANSPSVEVSCDEIPQVHRTDVVASPLVPGADCSSSNDLITANKLQHLSGSIYKQDKDNAASSVSGRTGSDVSCSKGLKCHVCKVRTGSLVKCSTCDRRYHRHCHDDLPDPCSRCKRVMVALKRSTTPASSPVPGKSAQKKQRPSDPSANQLGGTVDKPSGIEEQDSNDRSTPSSTALRKSTVGRDSTSVWNDRLDPIDHLDEAHMLVDESFATASGKATPKPAGTLKIVKHKISVPGLEHQNQRHDVAGSVPAAEHTKMNAVSAPGPPIDNPHTRLGVVGQKLQNDAKAEDARAKVSASPFNDFRSAGGKKAKKTPLPKTSKCTACNQHSVPFNPLGRTICQKCKDAETKMLEPSEPTVAAPPCSPMLGHDHVENDPDVAGDVEAVLPHDKQVRDATAGGANGHAGETVRPDSAVQAGVAPTEVAPNNIMPRGSPVGGKVPVAEPPTAEPQPGAEGDQEPSANEKGSSDSTDEEDVPLSTLSLKRALNPKLSPAAAKRTRTRQTRPARGPYDLGDSFERPANTYRRLIQLAISDTPDGRLRAAEVTKWISSNVPGYKLGQGSWANAIMATMIFGADNISKKHGAPYLKRYGPGGGMDWYELLPELKEKVERWDAALSRPILRPVREVEETTTKPCEASTVEVEPLTRSAHKSAQSPRSTGQVKTIAHTRKQSDKWPAQKSPPHELMEVDSELVVDQASSPEQPLAQVAAKRQAVTELVDISDVSMEGLNQTSPVANGAGIVDTLAGTTPIRERAPMDGRFVQTFATTKKASRSIHDMTLKQVLACRPPAVYTELYKAWPSLDPPKTEFDYEAKMAEIRARPGRKERFGQKRPVDAEKVLSVVGPSEEPPWPPIDNSFGLTQAQFGDEQGLEHCETWDEFFGTTEQVKPCIVEGKLAYRPVGEKSRAVFKTSI